MTSANAAMTSSAPIFRTLPFLLLFLFFFLPHCSQGAIFMEVSPYPARVYERAPPGVAVLTVKAYDNETGQPLTSFRLEKRGLSEYFSINSSGVMYTARSIDRILGFVFRFFVFAVGSETNSVEWKHVMVEVSKKNQHPPHFNQATFTTFVYRHSPPGTPITTLHATDADLQPYNHRFSFSFPPHLRQQESRFLNLTASGDVILARAPPEAVRVMRVLVQAVDEGSPALTGTASLVVVVDDIKQPDTFCLSTSHSEATLCWKNPMPGRLDPQGNQYSYQVQLQGAGLNHEYHVHGDSGARELCMSTSGLETGQEYSLQVTVVTNLTASTPAVQLTFQKLGPGFSMECVTHNFSACNFLHPCQNGASCEEREGEGGGMDYTCRCQAGWQGHNCTNADLCAVLPCQNGGHCVYTGHEQYRCDCPPLYAGPLCQIYNICAAEEPCQNGGVCRMYDNGTHHCACPNFFTGSNCSDPDPCRPSPCGQRGECVQVSETEVECRCYHGYFGERCSEVDLCQSDQPCQHGGTCLTTANSTVTCVCPQNFTGPFCEAFNSCTLACRNNATCTLSPDYQYICTCLPGYYGDECQFYDRCHSNPCLHNGACNGDENEQRCQCLPGYWGSVCQHYNACLTEPCQGRGLCVDLDSENGRDGELPYECQCYDSWWGPECQYPNPCHIGVCKNGATCEHQPPDPFRCVCSEGHHGDLCQHIDPCHSSPCPSHASCVNLTHSDFLCVCPPGYSGARCQYSPVRCDLDPCPTGSRCQPTTGVNDTSLCVCLPGRQPPDCSLACAQETTEAQSTGRLTWPPTVVGAEAEVTCPFGGKLGKGNMAKRRCLQDDHHLGAVWGQVDDSDCMQLSLHKASQRLRALRDLTSDPTTLGSAEVSNVTSALEHLYGFTLMDPKAAYVMMEVISNLCDVSMAATIASNKENNTSDRLLNLMDKYSAEVTLSYGMHVTLTSRNFELKAMLIQNTSSKVHYVPSLLVSSGITLQMNISITIPPEAFRRRAANGRDEYKATTAPEVTRLQFMGHWKAQLFIPDGSAYTGQWVRRQAVVSCTVTGRPVVSLSSSPVVIRVRNPQPTSNYTCVFWNPHKRQWSTEGVVSVVKSGNWSVCESSHLTSFALLLDPSPDDHRVGKVQGTVLTYISFIGSGLSLFSLSLTLLTYALFRSLNKDKSGKILLHLCLALSLLHLLFLLNGLALPGSGSKEDNQTSAGCCTVAALLHFSLLSSLSWMLVEAVEMYQALVRVFTKYASCYMLKRSLLGWGLPLVIVLVTVGVDRDNYNSNRGYCFVSSSRPAAYYGSVVAPACGVLVVNSVLFVLVTRVLLTPRFQQHRPSTPGLTPTQVRGAFTVMILLGVTWVFGPLAIREAKLVFNYLFCIFNSLQGFLIFVFRCLFNPEVRLCWLHLLKTGTLKKKRGPLHSRLISESSSRGDMKSVTSPHGGANKGSSSLKTTSRHTLSNGCHHKVNGSSGRNGTVQKNKQTLGLEAAQNHQGNIHSTCSHRLPEENPTNDEHLSTPGETNIALSENENQTPQPKGEETSNGSPVTSENMHGQESAEVSTENATNQREESSHVLKLDHVSQSPDPSSDSEEKLSGLANGSDELTKF